jgi:hypothetical protein
VRATSQGIIEKDDTSPSLMKGDPAAQHRLNLHPMLLLAGPA